MCRAHILEFVLDLISVKRRLGIGGGRLRRRSPLRLLLHVARRPGPSGNKRGVDIVTVRRRPGDAHEVIGVVGIRLGRRGPGAGLNEAGLPRDDTLRHGKAGKVVPDQERQRLAEIEWCLAGRTKQVSGIEFRHGYLCRGQIGGEHQAVGPYFRRQEVEIDPVEDAACVGRLDEIRVRGLRRPACHVAGAEIGRVDLGAADLGKAFDPMSGDSRRALPAGAVNRLRSNVAGEGLCERLIRPDGNGNAARSGHAQDSPAVHPSPRRSRQCPGSPSCVSAGGTLPCEV